MGCRDMVVVIIASVVGSTNQPLGSRSFTHRERTAGVKFQKPKKPRHEGPLKVEFSSISGNSLETC